MNEKITAVIVAAGSGTRMGGKINKVFMPLGGSTVIDYAVASAADCRLIDDIVIVTRECDVLECMEHIKNIKKSIRIVKGGATRQESVRLGLSEAEGASLVAIHDGARALVTPEIFSEVIKEAKMYGAAACGTAVTDSLKKVNSHGFITETVKRENIYAIQTPQVFDYDRILCAHQKAAADGFFATDDCAIYEKYVGEVRFVEGSYENIKLTTPEDMIIAENILKKRNGLI